jgi:hypothetical protein
VSSIFISYRRADSAAICGRIYDRLVAAFGRDAIFKDVDSIPLGTDFAQYIGSILAQCAAQVVVIGPRWLSLADESGRRRLDDPGDYVRLEVEGALRRGIPVVPVLVDGATMPPVDHLPPSLQQLARLPSLPVRPDPDFGADVQRLVAALARWAPARPASPGWAPGAMQPGAMQPGAMQPGASRPGPYPPRPGPATPGSYAPTVPGPAAQPYHPYAPPAPYANYAPGAPPSSTYGAYGRSPQEVAAKRARRWFITIAGVVAALVLIVAGVSVAYLRSAAGTVPYLGGSQLWDVVAAGPGRYWAVGSEGAILRTQGGGWVVEDSPTHTLLRGVAMTANGAAGWAVGDNGAIVRYSGGKWTAYPAVTTVNLWTVAVTPDGSEGWAGGEKGVILHYAGGSWSVWRQDDGDFSLVAFAVNSPTDAWMSDGGGVLFHYDGTQWSDYADSADILRFAMASSTDGWAVGTSGILRYDGAAWRAVPAPAGLEQYTSLDGLALPTPSEGWAAGSGANRSYILHYTGGAWTLYPGTAGLGLGSTLYLRGLAMGSPGEGWIVAQNGAMLRCQNGVWSVFCPAGRCAS